MADLTIHNWPRKVYIAYLRDGKFANNYFEKIILLHEKFLVQLFTHVANLYKSETERKYHTSRVKLFEIFLYFGSILLVDSFRAANLIFHGEN